MVKPKISVILPIYNIEDYLEECLNSILNQTIIDDIEVLMIDDESTDDSRYIIEKYALDYDNFHAYHKKNEGQGVARNYGVELAKGEYIHFLDSDDYIAPDTYEKLYNLTINNNYDFVVGNALRFNNYNCWEEWVLRNAFENIGKSRAFNHMKENPYFVWDTVIWNKLYRKDFLIDNDIKFPNKKIYYEDLIFALESYINAKSFYFIDDYIYYWRVRTNKSSVTQTNTQIKNFKDRLEIMLSMKDLIDKTDFDERTLELLYEKWLFHDIKVYLSTINEYPEEYLDEILKDINSILDFIPDYIINNLNSYRKILYEMVKNNDLGSLLYFAPLENKIRDNPRYPVDLKQKYMDMINFKEDALSEKLEAKKVAIKLEDENLVIDFEEKIHYVSRDNPHKTEAALIDEENNEDELEVKNNQIFIPLDLIKNKKETRIKMKYICDSFEKEAYLKNNRRGSFITDGVDLEIGIEANSLFFIRIRKANDNEILISEVDYEDEYFTFKGNMNEKLDNVIIQNVFGFKEYVYPIEMSENEDSSYDISFKIPYEDIIMPPVKKWELKSNDEFKSFKIAKNFEFFNERDKILFKNHRNKILIEDEIINQYEKLEDLSNKLEKGNKNKKDLKKDIKKLNEDNKKIKKENKKIRKSINNYKNRKIVKIFDKTKSIIKK